MAPSMLYAFSRAMKQTEENTNWDLFVCCWLSPPAKPIIPYPLSLFLMRPLQSDPSWLSSVYDLFAQEECLQPPQAKWHSGHVRFSLCLCNFLSNEPSNSYFITPEAKREKGGVILVPVGHPPPLSPSLPIVIFLSSPVSVFSPLETGWDSTASV